MGEFSKKEIEDFKLRLRVLGEVDDVSNYNMPIFRKTVQKSLVLYLDSYDDTTDSQIDIEILKEGTFLVNKSKMAFDIYNNQEKSFLENTVRPSSFKLVMPTSDILIPHAHLTAETDSFDKAYLLVRELEGIIQGFVECFGNADFRNKKFHEEWKLRNERNKNMQKETRK